MFDSKIKTVRRFRLALGFLIALLVFAGNISAAQTNSYSRQEDVIYGRKFGTALTLDVFSPVKTNNGVGIIFVVSGGWFSAHEAINLGFIKPLIRRGYTVFAVVHGSQPKFKILEIISDMNRAVRFIRFNAKKFGVDANRLGVTGGSAGGHLSLILGTQGALGAADAKDPVDRESSAVQVVACFFPPTDFLNYGKLGNDAMGDNELKNFRTAFGDIPTNAEVRIKYGQKISPVYSVSSNTPPTLIIHGDADKLVPIQQAEIFVEAAKKSGVTAELVTKPGKAHGWPDWADDFELCADWFDAHLRGIKREANVTK